MPVVLRVMADRTSGALLGRGVPAACVILLAAGTLAAPPGAAVTSKRSVAASGFQPQSVSFVGQSIWSVGTVACPGHVRCPELWESGDSGKRWARLALPPALSSLVDRARPGTFAYDSAPPVLNVRFANARDGWLFGNIPLPARVQGVVSTTWAPALWATHDGGSAWRAVAFKGLDRSYPYGAVLDLGAAGGTAYLVVAGRGFHAQVESSPVTGGLWHTDPAPPLPLPAGGGETSGDFVFVGGQGWLVEGNGRGVTGSARLESSGKWATWRAPCRDVGDGYPALAASSATNLVAMCTIGGFVASRSPADPPGSVPGLSTWLYGSDNGGESFRPVAGLAKRGRPVFNFDVLASPSPGVVLTSRDGRLVPSSDGGRHWEVVYRRGPSYVHFSGSRDGIGLFGTGYMGTMALTHDGGMHWQPVPLPAVRLARPPSPATA